MLDFNIISLSQYILKFITFFTYFSSLTKYNVLNKRLKALYRFSYRYFKDPFHTILLLPPCVQKVYYEEDPNDSLHFFKSKRFFICLLYKSWYFLKYIHILNYSEKVLYLDYLDFIFCYWEWGEKNKTFYKLYNIDKIELFSNPTNKHFITHISLNILLKNNIEKVIEFSKLNFLKLENIEYIYKYLYNNLKFQIEEVEYTYTQLRPLRRRKRKYKYDKHKELRLELRKERERLREIRIAEELKEKEEKRKIREELKNLKSLEKNKKE